MNIKDHLLSIADPPGSDYHEFNLRIVATAYPMAGVRMPALRHFSRQLADSIEASEFIAQGVPPEPLYEEVLLQGLVLARLAGKHRISIDQALNRLDLLIPRFDSWAHVDVVVSEFKIFDRHKEEVLQHFLPLKAHPGEFTKRTFVILLMCFFLDEDNAPRTLQLLKEVPQGQYYVDMALAWALSVALVKHYELTVPLLETPDGRFSRFVHNKAIQKARESYRITPEKKAYLNSLKIKQPEK